jgi:4'-phosphopantetheinyl transferase
MVLHIEVWTVTLDKTHVPQWPLLGNVLGEDERARAARFVFDRHRRGYVAAHALKRLMLSAIGGMPPQFWTFETTRVGKPRIGPMHGPSFNLSRSEGLVACAVSQDLEVGIDVEPVNRNAPFELARRHFTAEENRWINSLPQPERPLGFFRVWTLKEAYIKATGRGLAQPLHDFTFSFDPLRVSFHNRALGDSQMWHFEQWLIGREHLLALAWHAEVQDVSVTVREMHLEKLLDQAIESDR